jgi:hypothetical protein
VLKQFSSQPTALKRGINRDIKQRRFIKNNLRDREAAMVPSTSRR